MEKTSVFNLIILDESGSMNSARNATIDGCNETINMVKSAQKTHADTQKHFISIYAFQSNQEIPSRYLCKNVKPEDARYISAKDYKPWGATPMLDAIGMTISDLKAVAATHDDAVGMITIITDGYENSSCEYSWKQVRDLISEVKELGWQVNFIGANIDVDKVADNLNIQSRMQFRSDDSGTRDMHALKDKVMSECYASLADDSVFACSKEERIRQRKERACKNLFGKG